MDLGVQMPRFEDGDDPTAPALMREFARDAEAAGLASLWTSDSTLRPTEQPIDFGGGVMITTPEESARQYKALELLAFLSACTTRIALGTSTLVTLFQNPATLAGRIATVDRLSDGRLLLGIGQGWVPQEFEAAGVPLRRRGAGFEEHLLAMRAAWGPDPVRFEGRFYRIPSAQIGPKPYRAKGPRLFVGAATPTSLERAGRLGLGLNPVFFGWDALTGALAVYRRAAEESGHDPSALPVVVSVNGAVTVSPVDDAAPLTGSPEQVAADLARVADLGVGHVLWNMIGVPAPDQLEAMTTLVAIT